MKKPSFKSILTVVAVLLFATFAAACTGETKEKPYDYLVTFNYNVGEIVADAADQYLGVKSGGKVGLQPNQGAFEGKTVQGYYVEGWYLPKVDENGNPVVGDDKRVVLDKKWDFANDTVSKDITLYANLVRFSKLIVKIEGEDDIEHTGALGANVAKPGEKNRRYPKKEGWTFVDYYEDADYQTPFDWTKPYTYTADDKTVYAKFIEGEWELIYDAATFKAAIALSKNIYLMKDIDFTGEIWGSNSSTLSLNGIINGNGHKLTGISCDFKYSRTFSSDSYALFDKITAKSEIYDLTIENAKLSLTSSGAGYNKDSLNAALFAGKIEAGAKLTNVKVSGTLTIGTVELNELNKLHVGGFAVEDAGAVTNGCDFTGITVINPYEEQD